MRVHLRDTTLASDNGRTTPVAALAGALRWELKDLDGGRFGLCPEPDRCVPLPAEAVDRDALRLDHTDTLATLGLVMAHDNAHTVIEVSAAGQRGLGTGDPVDMHLPDVHTGVPTPLAEPGRPTAIYAWASW